MYTKYKQKGGTRKTCLPIPVEQYQTYTFTQTTDIQNFKKWLDKMLDIFKSINEISEKVKPFKLQLDYTLFRGVYYVHFSDYHIW